MDEPNAKRIFFPNLNGLRFIAAALVLTSHIEAAKYSMGFANLWSNQCIQAIGGLGVTLFFVLSGFLITYLLLAEKDTRSTISIKKFYLKRVLRIWPLYYLMVIPALFLIPHIPWFDVLHLNQFLGNAFYIKAVLYLLILPNVAQAAYCSVPYASQTWSIGVEEQFYFIWPIIINYFKNYLEILVVIIIMLVLLPGLSTDIVYLANKVFHFYPIGSLQIELLAQKIYTFFYMLRIGCMAIGGIGAYILFYKKEAVLSIIYARSLQIFIYVILIYMFYKGFRIDHEFYALFFVIIILNLASNKNSILNLEIPILSYLGNISYGIYMYHMLAITFAIKSVQLYDANVKGILANFLLYLLAFLYTIAMASASYYLFEKNFLNLKKKL